MTNIRSLVNDITSSDNVSAAEKISDIMAEKLQTLLDLAKIEVAQGMFNTCEECEEPVLTQEQYDMLSDDEKADYEAIDEALVGNQKKIDANKNGKLDAQDFKMLRAKKGMKEDVGLEEGNKENKDKKNIFVQNKGKKLSPAGYDDESPDRATWRKLGRDAMKKEEVTQEAYTDPYAAKKAAEMKKAHAATMADAKKEYDAAKKTKFAKNFMKMKKEEVEQMDEVITKKTPTGEVISDFVHSKNPMFKGKSKKERIRMALGAKYAMMRKEEVELDEANKENKAMKNAFVKKQGDKNPQQEKDSMGMPVKQGHVAVKHGGVKGGRLGMKQKKDPLASGTKRSEFTDASKKMISKSQNAAVKQQPKPKLP